MKNASLIILFALLFICIKNDDYSHICEYGPTDSVSVEGCRRRATETDYTHCCYIELDDYGQCIQLIDDAYENIKSYKNYLKNKYEHVKIKCSSQIISLSLITLLALFTLF